MDDFLHLLGMAVIFGVLYMSIFGEDLIETWTKGKAKIAEAEARAEEAKLERARLEAANRHHSRDS